jgi:hypothetical protein
VAGEGRHLVWRRPSRPITSSGAPKRVSRISVWKLSTCSSSTSGPTRENGSTPLRSSQGKIKFFGVSINDHQPENAIKLVETGALDTVQVIYNISSKTRKRSSSLPANVTTSA